MGEGPVRYCGRDFTDAELHVVRRISASSLFPTRTSISREVCRELNWRKPDGGLKEGSCRVALLRMQKDGRIALPAARASSLRPWVLRCTAAGDPQAAVSGRRSDLGAIELRAVQRRQESHLWNELVARYHYLGYKPLAGAQVRYLAYAGTRLLAVLGFGAAAWRVYDRDAYIGWTDAQRLARLHLVVNQARFLVLPWIRVKYLASNLLAQAARQLVVDWESRYRFRPLLLETYVECDRFRATSYRAANWVFVGETMARGKLDRRNVGPTTSFKSIWCYPLHPAFRAALCAPLPAEPAAASGGTHA